MSWSEPKSFCFSRSGKSYMYANYANASPNPFFQFPQLYGCFFCIFLRCSSWRNKTKEVWFLVFSGAVAFNLWAVRSHGCQTASKMAQDRHFLNPSDPRNCWHLRVELKDLGKVQLFHRAKSKTHCTMTDLPNVEVAAHLQDFGPSVTFAKCYKAVSQIGDVWVM